MRAKSDNIINDEHPLGKGEVVSSILTGSTRKPHEIRASDTPAKFRSAVRDATKREHDISTRGKSVEFVRGSFAPPFAEVGAMSYPWRTMNRPSIDAAGLAQFARKDRLLREVILRGGSMTWPGLFERGHKHPTVRLCVRESLLTEPTRHHYEITQAGRDTIAQLDHAKWTGIAS